MPVQPVWLPSRASRDRPATDPARVFANPCLLLRFEVASERHSRLGAMASSQRAPHQHAANLADDEHRVQSLRADVRAIQDGTASEQAVRVLELIEPCARGLVAAVDEEAVGLQHTHVESHAVKVADILSIRVVSVSDDTPNVLVIDMLDARGIRRVPFVTADALAATIGRPDGVRALAAASACRPDASPSMDNESIQRASRSQLESQPWWRPTRSRFDVRAGVVHFQGLVESAEEVRAARVAAENLPGVRGVVDHRLDALGTSWGWW